MSDYVFSVRRRGMGQVFTVDKAMTEEELEHLTPAIIKDIFWKMVEQMRSIK